MRRSASTAALLAAALSIHGFAQPTQAPQFTISTVAGNGFFGFFGGAAEAADYTVAGWREYVREQEKEDKPTPARVWQDSSVKETADKVIATLEPANQEFAHADERPFAHHLLLTLIAHQRYLGRDIHLDKIPDKLLKDYLIAFAKALGTRSAIETSKNTNFHNPAPHSGYVTSANVSEGSDSCILFVGDGSVAAVRRDLKHPPKKLPKDSVAFFPQVRNYGIIRGKGTIASDDELYEKAREQFDQLNKGGYTVPFIKIQPKNQR